MLDMTRRTMLAAGAATGLAGILSGCALGPKSSSAPSAQESSGPVSLRLVRTGTPTVLHPIFDPMIASYQQSHPGVTVTIEDLGWTDAERSLSTMAASRSLPDVMYHLPAKVFEMADQGLIADLKDKIDPKVAADVYPSMLGAGQYKGAQYLVPSSGSTLLMWYRADVFLDAGLDPNQPPKTWADLLAAAKQIKEKTSVAPIGLYSKPAGGETSFMFESFFASAIGGNTWDGQAQRYQHELSANRQVAVQTLDFLKSIAGLAQAGLAETGRFDVRPMMRDKKAAIVFDVANMAPQVQGLLDNGTVKVAQIPAGPSGKSISAINLGGWFVPTNSKSQKAAADLVNYMMQTPNQLAHEKYGSVPILKSEGANYVGPYWDVIKASVESGVSEGISPKTGALWAVTGEQLQLLMIGRQTPDQTLDAMVAGYARAR